MCCLHDNNNEGDILSAEETITAIENKTISNE